MFQFSGSVWVGPGVSDSDVGVGMGVEPAVVAVGDGVVVPTGAGWVHPAASTSSMKNTSAVVTITIFFIWECCPGGYLRIVPLRVS